MANKNAPAGFWIRLLTKGMDFSWVVVSSVAILFSMLEKKQYYQFKADWCYYVWTIVTIILLLISFIVVPYFTKGKTLSMYLTRIKIVASDEKKLLSSLIKREFLFSIAWAFMMLLAMVIINHTLVNDFAKPNQDSISYSNLDKLRIGVVSTAGTIMLVLQLISIVGIIIKKDKRGFHDNASHTSTVWVNKFVEITKEKFVKQIQPRPVNDEIVEWITK